MEQLALEIYNLDGIGSKYATLPKDSSITITDTSEIFGNGDKWSHSFILNVYANAHIFGTSGDMHGSRLHEQVNMRKARLWIEGLPILMGYLRLDDEVDVDKEGNIDISLESGRKTFEQMIEGGKANQVPLMGDVLIGMALWRERVFKNPYYAWGLVFQTKEEFYRATSVDDTYNKDKYIKFYADLNHITEGMIGNIGRCCEYPRMVFPKGEFIRKTMNSDSNNSNSEEINRLNVDLPYDNEHPYCNINLCYQKHGYTTVNGEADYSSEEVLREYEIAPANRVNSAPNFYVIYWLKCLMQYLGIHIDENQMMGIEDMRRLFLVNTNCAYEVPKEFDRTGEIVDERFGCFTTSAQYYNYIAEDYKAKPYLDRPKLKVVDYTLEVKEPGDDDYHEISPDKWYYPKDGLHLYTWDEWPTERDSLYFKKPNRTYHYAYATSECFPNVDISEIISALETGFGIRFIFDSNYQRVRIILLRNIFRDQSVQEINCNIFSAEKSENNIRGFRMTYGKGDEDTAFYYKGFADKLSKSGSLWADNSDTHDYSRWNLNANYQSLINSISAFDKTCYVTKNNGNAYGIKVDKDAKKYEDLHPALFGFADFMDAEDGDCSGEDDTIHEVNVGFTPAIMNDVNIENERNSDDTQQYFALFVDEEMRARRPDLGDLEPPSSYNDSDAVYDAKKVKSNQKEVGRFSVHGDAIINTNLLPYRTGQTFYYPSPGQSNRIYLLFRATAKTTGRVDEGYSLYLQDNYEPNDDGIAPIETHDWGLTLGIMRGSGSDAYVKYSTDPDDGEDNTTWEIEPGSSVTAHPDTCDNYGRTWDYDGETGYKQTCTTAADALEAMPAMFPDTNFALTNRSTDSYLTGFLLPMVTDNTGVTHTLLMAGAVKDGSLIMTSAILQQYIDSLQGKSIDQMIAWDAENSNLFIEADSSRERAQTLLRLQKLAYDDGGPVTVSGGTDIREGRFSLKLRAEKPNPYYDPQSDDPEKRKKYLDITDPNLQGRGLADQFYKEYSYWVRNAKKATIQVEMTLAQLLAIDKTKRVRVGNIVGFVNKYQFTVSIKNGMGPVDMEIWYL